MNVRIVSLLDASFFSVETSWENWSFSESLNQSLIIWCYFFLLLCFSYFTCWNNWMWLFQIHLLNKETCKTLNTIFMWHKLSHYTKYCYFLIAFHVLLTFISFSLHRKPSANTFLLGADKFKCNEHAIVTGALEGLLCLVFVSIFFLLNWIGEFK